MQGNGKRKPKWSEIDLKGGCKNDGDEKYNFGVLEGA